MPKTIKKQVDFIKGEINPQLIERTETGILNRSCAYIQNMYSTIIGTLKSRPGTSVKNYLRLLNEKTANPSSITSNLYNLTTEKYLDGNIGISNEIGDNKLLFTIISQNSSNLINIILINDIMLYSQAIATMTYTTKTIIKSRQVLNNLQFALSTDNQDLNGKGYHKAPLLKFEFDENFYIPDETDLLPVASCIIDYDPGDPEADPPIEPSGDGHIISFSISDFGNFNENAVLICRVIKSPLDDSVEITNAVINCIVKKNTVTSYELDTINLTYGSSGYYNNDIVHFDINSIAENERVPIVSAIYNSSGTITSFKIVDRGYINSIGNNRLTVTIDPPYNKIIKLRVRGYYKNIAYDEVLRYEVNYISQDITMVFEQRSYEKVEILIDETFNIATKLQMNNLVFKMKDGVYTSDFAGNSVTNLSKNTTNVFITKPLKKNNNMKIFQVDYNLAPINFTINNMSLPKMELPIFQEYPAILHNAWRKTRGGKWYEDWEQYSNLQVGFSNITTIFRGSNLPYNMQYELNFSFTGNKDNWRCVEWMNRQHVRVFWNTDGNGKVADIKDKIWTNDKESTTGNITYKYDNTQSDGQTTQISVSYPKNNEWNSFIYFESAWTDSGGDAHPWRSDWNEVARCTFNYNLGNIVLNPKCDCVLYGKNDSGDIWSFIDKISITSASETSYFYVNQNNYRSFLLKREQTFIDKSGDNYNYYDSALTIGSAYGMTGGYENIIYTRIINFKYKDIEYFIALLSGVIQIFYNEQNIFSFAFAEIKDFTINEFKEIKTAQYQNHLIFTHKKFYPKEFTVNELSNQLSFNNFKMYGMPSVIIGEVKRTKLNYNFKFDNLNKVTTNSGFFYVNGIADKSKINQRFDGGNTYKGHCIIKQIVNSNEAVVEYTIPFLKNDNWISGIYYVSGYSPVYADTDINNSNGSIYYYPSACCFYQDRLWFGGGMIKPAFLIGSRLNDFSNFNSGKNGDSEAIQIEILDSKPQEIIELYGNRGIQIFTRTTEFFVNDENLTPSNFSIKKVSNIGISPYISPVNLIVDT